MTPLGSGPAQVIFNENYMKNLLIADDHIVLRQALCEMLESRGDFKVLAQASDGQELLDLLEHNKPDLVIMDIAMPKLDGLATLAQLNQRGSCPPVLILSADEGERKVRTAMLAGARGYLPKNVSIDELRFAINSILEGKTYLSPTVTASLVNGDQTSNSGSAAISVLSKREVEILTHLADGKPNRVIGKLLHISTRTVDTHRSNILKKLKVKTNAELVKIAITSGLITV